MSAGDRYIAFYRSMPQECGYLPGRQAVNAVMDPAVIPDIRLYSQLVELGFRRSGVRIYRPNCPGCAQCLALRLAVRDFTPNRSQRRTWKRFSGMTVIERGAEFRAEHYTLYLRYLQSRHPAAGMDDARPEDYLSFLIADGVQTRFIEFSTEGRCLAIAVVDVLTNGMSAVYTFFDPDLPSSGLGVYAVMWQIEAARSRGARLAVLGLLDRRLPQDELQESVSPV
jgi:arginine-tRNA-protein transferase